MLIELHIFTSPPEDVHRKVDRTETIIHHQSRQIMSVRWLSGHAAQNWVAGARPLIRTGYNSLLPLIDPLLLDGVKRLNCSP